VHRDASGSSVCSNSNQHNSRSEYSTSQFHKTYYMLPFISKTCLVNYFFKQIVHDKRIILNQLFIGKAVLTNYHSLYHYHGHSYDQIKQHPVPKIQFSLSEFYDQRRKFEHGCFLLDQNVRRTDHILLVDFCTMCY
jgi:hypothetical protein